MSFLAPSSALALCPLRLCVGIFVLLTTTACFTQQAQSPPSKPAPPPLEFLGAWGIKGDGPGQFSNPNGIAVDSVGSVFIVDAASKFIHKFSPDGHPLLSFQDAYFKVPSGIAVDRGGAIYVCDYSQNVVLIYLPTGERFRTIRGGHGRRFDRPVAIAVDDEGGLFVLDQDGHRIQKFDGRARFVMAWGKPGAKDGEFQSAFDLTVGKDGFLYVADTDNHRVQKFSRDGEFLAAWNIPLATADSLRVRFVSAIAVSDKYVYLANSLRRTIDVWTVEGRHVIESKLEGRLPPGPPEISGLALSPHGELFILDPVGARVLRFRINF